jgi:hypothetical protein
MHVQLSHLHPSPLPRPEPGQSERFRLGHLELVLEPVRGGYSLLCLDGQSARTWTLGLAEQGELWIECRVPQWPLRVALKETLVLVPGGRVRGYVEVPLVPAISWRTADGAVADVAEMLPALLSTEWDDVRGTVTHRWTSPLFQRIPPAGAEARAVVPLALANCGPRMQSPESLPVQLTHGELQSCRGHLVASPRRLRFDADGQLQTTVRRPRQEHSA